MNSAWNAIQAINSEVAELRLTGGESYEREIALPGALDVLVGGLYGPHMYWAGMRSHPDHASDYLCSGLRYGRTCSGFTCET